MKEYDLKDLKIGMKISGCQREYDFSNYLTIEVAAHDYAVGRSNDGDCYMIYESSNMQEYKEDKDIEEEDVEDDCDDD